MKCQFILTVWILYVAHQINCLPTPTSKPISRSDSLQDASTSAQNGAFGDDEDYDISYEPTEDLGEIPDSKEVSDEDPEDVSHSVEGSNEAGEAGEETPESGKDSGVKGSEPTKPEENHRAMKPGYAAAVDQKEEPVEADEPSDKLSGKKQPEKETTDRGKTSAAALDHKKETLEIEKLADKRNDKPLGKQQPEKDIKETDKGKKSADDKPNGKDNPGGARSLPQEQKAAAKSLPKVASENGAEKPTNKPNNTLTKQKARPGTKVPANAKAPTQVLEYSGSISDLLTTISKRVNSFEDVNKNLLRARAKPKNKSAGVSGRSTGVSGRSVGSSPAARSLPAPMAARGVWPSAGAKSLPLTIEEPKPEEEEDTFSAHLSPFARRKEAQRLQTLYGSGSPTPSVPKALSKAPSTVSNAGTAEYERLLALRGRQLDAMSEEKPAIAMKSLPTTPTTPRALPKKLKSVSGTFESIANQLQDNIKSVSAVNKEKLRAVAPARMSARGIGAEDPATTGTRVGSRMVRRGTGEGCPCNYKYSPLNSARRSVKRVVRVMKNSSNAVYDGVVASIDKSKDVKDAVRNDIVDPAVRMIPIVTPVVEGIVDAGDAVADSTISTAKGIVQGGRGLNDRLYTSVESMLKKDKTCVCP